MLSNTENHDPTAPAEIPEKPSEVEPLEEEISAKAMEMMPADVHPGDVVQGKIIKVSPEEIIVDVGLKSEGVIPLEDCRFGEESVNLYIGKEIAVLVVQQEGSDGLPVLPFSSTPGSRFGRFFYLRS